MPCETNQERKDVHWDNHKRGQRMKRVADNPERKDGYPEEDIRSLRGWAAYQVSMKGEWIPKHVQHPPN
jgi:hypothetical protein